MLLTNVFRQPRGQRFVLERISKSIRRAIWRVWVPEIHVQEPVVASAVLFDPVDCNRRDLIGALEPTFAGVEDFIEAGVPVESGVPLAEGTNGCGLESGVAKALHPAGLAERR